MLGSFSEEGGNVGPELIIPNAVPYALFMLDNMVSFEVVSPLDIEVGITL
jgi:hypothetical protein